MINNRFVVRKWALVVAVVLTVFAVVDLAIGNFSPMGANFFFKQLIIIGKLLIPLCFYVLAFKPKK